MEAEVAVEVVVEVEAVQQDALQNLGNQVVQEAHDLKLEVAKQEL
jgi:hypothetical protein